MKVFLFKTPNNSELLGWYGAFNKFSYCRCLVEPDSNPTASSQRYTIPNCIRSGWVNKSQRLVAHLSISVYPNSHLIDLSAIGVVDVHCNRAARRKILGLYRKLRNRACGRDGKFSIGSSIRIMVFVIGRCKSCHAHCTDKNNHQS